jgi:DNA-binding transcriptional MocR family regulator
MRALYSDRRAALVEALGHELGSALRVIGDAAGMHLAVTARRCGAARRGPWVMSCARGGAVSRSDSTAMSSEKNGGPAGRVPSAR